MSIIGKLVLPDLLKRDYFYRDRELNTVVKCISYLAYLSLRVTLKMHLITTSKMINFKHMERDKVLQFRLSDNE